MQLGTQHDNVGKSDGEHCAVDALATRQGISRHVLLHAHHHRYPRVAQVGAVWHASEANSSFIRPGENLALSREKGDAEPAVTTKVALKTQVGAIAHAHPVVRLKAAK